MQRIRERIHKKTPSFAGTMALLANTFSVIEAVTGFIGFVMTILGLIFGGVAATRPSSNIKRFVIDVGQAGLGLRLFAMAAVAALLGFGLGGVCYLLSRRNTSNIVVVMGVLAIVWSLLLVATAQILTETSARTILPEFTTFLLVGLGICLWLLSFQMRAQSRVGTPTMIEDRSLIVFIFAMTAILGGMFVNLGAT